MARPGPSPDPIIALIGRLRDSRFSRGLHCPRCRDEHATRWGTFSGRQRYRCRACRRTFSDLTGTPVAYSKKLELWPSYCATLADGLSVRRTATLLGIHPATAFRWRHALLRGLVQQDDEVLEGLVELAFVRFVPSEKGSRTLDRPARERGPGVGRWFAAKVEVVVVACDRRGGCITAATGPSAGPAGTASLEVALEGRLGPAPMIACEQGRYGPAARYCRRRGGSFHDARALASAAHTRSSPRGTACRRLTHVRTARACVERLGNWLIRFRGVASRYLPNYLVWHREVDRAWRMGIASVALRWPLEGKQIGLDAGEGGLTNTSREKSLTALAHRSTTAHAGLPADPPSMAGQAARGPPRRLAHALGSRLPPGACFTEPG
jgi:transposase-like protein